MLIEKDVLPARFQGQVRRLDPLKLSPHDTHSHNGPKTPPPFSKGEKRRFCWEVVSFDAHTSPSLTMFP
jgi:hypothetical protein